MNKTRKQQDQGSVLENRLAIFINDETVDPGDYETHIRTICSMYGKIRHMNIPELAKKRNLVFVEYFEKAHAEKALKALSSDKELKLNVSWARIPTKHSSPPENSGGAGQGQAKRSFGGGGGAGQNHRQQQPAPNANGAGGSLPFLSKPGTLLPSSTNAPTPKPNVEEKSSMKFQSRQKMAEKKFTPVPQVRKFMIDRDILPQAQQQQQPVSRPTVQPVQHSRVEKAVDDDMPQLESVAQTCNLCCKSANLRCERCGDFYCSIVCQKQDWKAHKPLCFPMPGLVSANDERFAALSAPAPVELKIPVSAAPSVKQQMLRTPPKQETQSPKVPVKFPMASKTPPRPAKAPSETATPPKPINGDSGKKSKKNSRRLVRYCAAPASGAEVIITWPVSTNAVFVVSMEKPEFAPYRDTLAQVDELAQNAAVLDSKPELGDLVFAKFEGDWCRGLVQKHIDEKIVMVAFFDFGNIALVNWNELRHYEPDGDITRYTFKVLLKNCPFVHDMKTEAYLKRMMDEYRHFIIRYSGELTRETKVCLYDKETCECVNDTICGMLGQKIDEPESEEEHVWTYNDLDEFDMETAGPTEVIILNNESLCFGVVHVTLKSTEDRIESIQSRVNRYAQEQGRKKQHSPEEQELCVVPDEDRNWQRAAMVNPACGEVYCVDFGSTMTVSKTDILKFDKDFADKLYAQQCAIMDLGTELDAQIVAELEKRLVQGKAVHVDRITRNPETKQFVLEMRSLIDAIYGN